MNEEVIIKLEKRIKDTEEILENLKVNPNMPDHFHNGFDASRIDYSDIYRKKVRLFHTIQGTAAATAANYGVFFIVPFTCVLTKFQEVHQTLGTDPGAVTLNLEKLTGTQALDAGAAMLSTALSLKATINTVQTGTLTETLANRNLAIGNRLAMLDAGTLTSVANVTIMVELELT